MEGSFALLLFAALFRFIDPGERNVPKERPKQGGRRMPRIPITAWTYTQENATL